MWSQRVLGPSGGPSERPGGLGIDVWSIWGSILGPIWEVVVIKIVRKSILRATKSFKVLNALLDGFPHWFFLDFGPILGAFWGWIRPCFQGVVDGCTLHCFFMGYLLILLLHRCSRIFQIYCKNGVILNIRTFLPHDSTIQTYIEKSSENGSEINQN